MRRHRNLRLTQCGLALIIFCLSQASCNNSKGSNSSSAPASNSTLAPIIIYSLPSIGTVNAALTTNTPTSLGGAITSCSSSPSLPTGLTLANDCTISGTPTSAISATNFVVTANNAGGNGTTVVSITINAAAPSSNYWVWQAGSSSGDGGVCNNSLGQLGGRVNPTMAADGNGNIYLFGGYDCNSNFRNDLWKFDGTEWKFVTGSTAPNQPGIYGAMGTPDATNVPGARQGAAAWVDADGNFWLFGGIGYCSFAYLGAYFLNDLWKFDGANWTWVSGSNNNSSGYTLATYGTKGTPGGNPGATWLASTARFNNKLYLFGGSNASSSLYLNALWSYDIPSGQWTWVAGSITDLTPTFGTKGVSDPSNTPAGMQGAALTTDSNGNLYLFGGYQGTPSTTYGDLWKFNGVDWTWVNGTSIPAQSPVFGVKGVAAATNQPGARVNGQAWIDRSNNFWYFAGADSTNTLWKFDGTNWTWVNGGAATIGTYGSKGVAASTNQPGYRTTSVGWTDNLGNLWLFGGVGFGANHWNTNLSDTWMYKP